MTQLSVEAITSAATGAGMSSSGSWSHNSTGLNSTIPVAVIR